jgi:hypothetical protein
MNIWFIYGFEDRDEFVFKMIIIIVLKILSESLKHIECFLNFPLFFFFNFWFHKSGPPKKKFWSFSQKEFHKIDQKKLPVKKSPPTHQSALPIIKHEANKHYHELKHMPLPIIRHEWGEHYHELEKHTQIMRSCGEEGSYTYCLRVGWILRLLI